MPIFAKLARQDAANDKKFMKPLLFFSCIFLEFITVIALIFSHFFDQDRIWPPESQKSWQRYFMLFLFASTAIIVIWLGLLDWGSDRFPDWFVIPGLIIWALGNLISIWAISLLGIKSTSGNPGDLIKQGPYQYSRNPQYLGFMISLFGWALITKSFYTLVVSLAAWIPLLIVPFIEEPWLLSKYGEDYQDYKQSVPRFLFRIDPQLPDPHPTNLAGGSFMPDHNRPDPGQLPPENNHPDGSP